MAPSILYHCTCAAENPLPPPPHLPSSAHAFHPLHTLFFCEECDAVRCNRCVSVEVSGYYCPNCLFEVPSASVRAEKNRCARNCFLCPHCRNTLSVVPSDPLDNGDSRSPVSPINEPPFFLYCNFCRWDSADVGITFDKPTGLALQLQKSEDSAPEVLEFERLKEHFEPILRASGGTSGQIASSTTIHHNPITAAASSALAREIPTIKYTSRRGARHDKEKPKEDPAVKGEYRARIEVGAGGGLGEEAEIEWLRGLESMGDVATLEQRWGGSWNTSMRASELRPLRIPLHSKKSKRCPTCRHILIKPEQKAQSVRYKIKLVAANYLPAIDVSITLASSLSAAATPRRGLKAPPSEDKEGHILPGKTYPFQLALTNPLYDPITVRLSVQRPPTAPSARRPPFAVSLPTNPFPISAFAEAWEYEDDEEMFDGDELAAAKEKDSKGKTKNVGVLERRANVTRVGGELVVAREARGEIKFNMLVSYTYRSDDPEPEGSELGDDGAQKAGVAKAVKSTPEMKTFSFYTVVTLGEVVPREEEKERRREGEGS